jgi:hypothetical protein
MGEMEKEFASFQRHMMDGINETMISTVVMTAVVPFIQAEMAAWDTYVTAACRRDPSAGPVEVALIADDLLAERRKRFTLSAVQARIIEVMREREPQTLCGKLVGDRGVCGREIDHAGDCKP